MWQPDKPIDSLRTQGVLPTDDLKRAQGSKAPRKLGRQSRSIRFAPAVADPAKLQENWKPGSYIAPVTPAGNQTAGQNVVRRLRNGTIRRMKYVWQKVKKKQSG